MSQKENLSAVKLNEKSIESYSAAENLKSTGKAEVIPSQQQGQQSEEDEDFLNDNQNGDGNNDDMYGGALESGWLNGLKGQKLIREAECLISTTLLRRDAISQPCLWHSILDDLLPSIMEPSLDTSLYDKDTKSADSGFSAPVMCSIQKIRDLWKDSMQLDINGSALAALCVRFGPPWYMLQNQLLSTETVESKSDRNVLKKKAYESFTSRTIVPTMSLQAQLDVISLANWLRTTEIKLEIIELQISRSALVMEPLRQEIGAPQLLGDICKSLGMPSVHGTELLALCRSAMLHARLSADMPCPVEVLEKYCMDRTQNKDAASKVRPMLMSLLRPKQHELEQMQRVLSNKGEYTNEIQQSGDSTRAEDAISNGGSDVDFVRTHAPPACHLLVILQKLPRNSAGLVPNAALLKEMKSQYLHLDAEFLKTLTSCWARGDAEEDRTVSAESISAFFCPGGLFSVRIRTPMNFGFKIGRPLKPTDPTEVIYQATIKQMFARLKTFSSLKYSSRVPTDVKLYADAERRRLIPRSKTVFVGNQVDDGDKLWASSEYISECMVQVEEADQEKLKSALSSREKDKADIKAMEREIKEKAEKAAAAAAAKAAKAAQAMTTAPAPRDIQKAKKDEKSGESLQAALDKLMQVSAPIHVPPYPPFPASLSEAHEWGIPLMVKYLRDEIELPQYIDQFMRMEITGFAFLRLTENGITRSFNLDHPLHSAKLANHARALRERVFEKAAIHRPHLVQDWESWHVSGWLAYKAECPACGHYTFTESALDGATLLSLHRASEDAVVEGASSEAKDRNTIQLRAALGPADDPEAPVALQAVLTLLGFKPLQEDAETHEKPLALGLNPDGGSRLARKRQAKKAQEEESKHIAKSDTEHKQDEADITDPHEELPRAAPASSPVSTPAPNLSALKSPKGGVELAIGATIQPLPAHAHSPIVAHISKANSAKTNEEVHDTTTTADVLALRQNIEQLQALVISQGAAIADLHKQGLDPVRQSILELRKDRLAAADQLQLQLQQNQQALIQQLESLSNSLRAQMASAATAIAASATNPNTVQMPTHLPIAPTTVDLPIAPPVQEPSAVLAVETKCTLQPDLKKSLMPQAVPLAAPPVRHNTANVSFADEVSPQPLNEETTTPSKANFTSLGKKLGLGDSRTLQDASDLVMPQPETKSESITSATLVTADVTGSAMDFQAIFNRTASDEIKVWKGIVQTYGHKNETNLTVTDTSAQLGRVACLWLRLGLRMLDDSRRRPDDVTDVGADGEPYLAMEIDEEDEDGAPKGLTRAVIGALRGMVKCVRALLHSSISDMGRRPEDTTDRISGEDIVGDRFVPDTHSSVKTKVRMTAEESAAVAKVTKAREQKRASDRMRLVSDQQHDYEVAAGLVFCLALVRRLLDKHPHQSDYTTLLFLFTRLREGNLPISEISRDNFRGLLTDTLRCQLPSWPQFDGMFQRFDPAQKGFVTAVQAVQALRNVNPLSDGLGPGDAQGLSLLMLSVAASQLSRKGKDLDAAFLEVIFSGAAHVPSFATLVGPRGKGRQARYEEDAFVGPDDGPLGMQELSANSLRMADETLLVCDLLTELVRPVFERIQEQGKKGSAKQAKVQTSHSSERKAQWRRLHASLSCPLPFVEPTPSTVLDACELTTRGLQIFEGRRKEEVLLRALGTVLCTELLFRVMCLRRLRTETEAEKSAEACMASLEDHATQVALSASPTMSLTIPQISNAMGALEADLIRLLGLTQAQAMLSRGPEDMSLEELERLMCELSGHAIPHGGVLGLYRSQVQVEIYLYHNWTSKTDKALETVNRQQQVYLSALKDISEDLRELRAEDAPEALPGSVAKKSGNVRTREIDGKVATYMTPSDVAASHLLTEMNDLMHRQRVDQAATYLNYLNGKAAAQRKKLEAALLLNRAAKRLGPGPHPHTPALDRDDALTILPPEEVQQRAHALQTQTQEEMRVPPAVHIQQLALRVNKFRHALVKGSIDDADNGLVLALREISVLEKQLLVSNDDILGLTESIIAHSKKYVDIRRK